MFPVDRPLAPGPGDNQALAVNTTDGTATYDVAFALVWVDGDAPALNRNEAYAFASCTGCAAVSVGFQVVLVTGDNHVAAPVNVSEAVNQSCVNCLTYALATQLFVTLDGPLSSDATGELNALWAQVADFGRRVQNGQVPVDGIQTQLTAYEQQILDIVQKDQGPLTPPASVAPVTEPSGSATTAASATSSAASATTSGAATSAVSATSGAAVPSGAAASSGRSAASLTSAAAPSTGQAPAGTGSDATDPTTGTTASSSAAPATTSSR